MRTYEYKKYMRDGTTRTITAVVRSRSNSNREGKQKRTQGKEVTSV